MKLNILLARTDELSSVFRRNLEDYIKFFKGNQNAFKGVRRTYTPFEGQIDEPGKREFKAIQTTAIEKLVWLNENAAPYIDALFSVERTNSANVAKAPLIVEGKNWGEFTSLELLRLKSLISEAHLVEMYSTIPVRSDEVQWNPTGEEMYSGRDVQESELTTSIVKTTTKEGYILPDPNVEKLKDASGYKPVVATKDTIVELGKATLQHFTGEWSHRERASVLKRRQILLMAVIEALKKANEVESVPSILTAEKIFGYLQYGFTSWVDADKEEKP